MQAFLELGQRLALLIVEPGGLERGFIGKGAGGQGGLPLLGLFRQLLALLEQALGLGVRGALQLLLAALRFVQLAFALLQGQ